MTWIFPADLCSYPGIGEWRLGVEVFVTILVIGAVGVLVGLVFGFRRKDGKDGGSGAASGYYGTFGDGNHHGDGGGWFGGGGDGGGGGGGGDGGGGGN
jgi:hypothetical protein